MREVSMSGLQGPGSAITRTANPGFAFDFGPCPVNDESALTCQIQVAVRVFPLHNPASDPQSRMACCHVHAVMLVDTGLPHKYPSYRFPRPGQSAFPSMNRGRSVRLPSTLSCQTACEHRFIGGSCPLTCTPGSATPWRCRLPMATLLGFTFQQSLKENGFVSFTADR